MNTRKIYPITLFLLVALALNACNLSAGPAPPADQGPQVPAPGVVQPPAGQAVQLGGQTQPTAPQGYVQVTLPPLTATAAAQNPPPASGGSVPQPTAPPPAAGGNTAPPSGGGGSTTSTPLAQSPFSGGVSALQITRVEALPNPVFYGSSCGSGQPTTLSVRAWVNDPSQVLQLQVEWKFPAAPAAPGQAMLMNPDGNGAYSIDLYSLGADLRLQGGSGEVMVTVSAFDKQQNYVAASPVRVQVLPCTAPAPPSITPTVTPSPIPAMQTRSGYVELHDSYQSGDKADMDFSGVPELVYFAPNENGVYYGHSLGQYVGEGEGICMTQVSSPSFEVCKAYQSCSPGIGPVQEGETYCYHTWNDVYGYFHIDKIENRAGFDMPDDWVISLSYTVWLP